MLRLGGLNAEQSAGGRLIQPYSYKPVDWGIQCCVCMLCHGRAVSKVTQSWGFNQWALVPCCGAREENKIPKNAC